MEAEMALNRYAALIASIALAILMLDISTPLGVAGGVPYVLCVWLATRSGHLPTVRNTVLATIGLVVVGLFMSPDGALHQSWVAYANRGLAIFAIIVSAGSGWWLGKMPDSMPALRVRLTFLAGALTLLTVFGATWLYAESQRHAVAHARGRTMVELTAQISHHDQILTMAAHLAAATGDLNWHQPYRISADLLDLALGNLSANLDELQPMLLVQSANDTLVEIEKRSFELVGEGAGELALTLLNSPEYNYAKAEFASTLALLQETIRAAQASYASSHKHLLRVETSVIVAFASGCALLWIVTFRNLQQQRRVAEAQARQLADSNQALNQSNSELKQFAFIASHDLQTPLRHISGFAQLLKNDYQHQLDETAQQWIGHMVGGVKHMELLIADLLTYSRIESTDTQFAPVALNQVLNKAQDLLHIAIEESRAAIVILDMPVVMGDETQLVQLFQNLIGNAIKYRSQERPLIEISASQRESHWLIVLRDNGIGVDPKQHQRVFEIFRRLHTQQEYPGSGIGLAICRRIVARHGGEIWLESTPGQGSAFHLTLLQEAVHEL